MSTYSEHKHADLHAQHLARRLDTEILTPIERTALLDELKSTEREVRQLWSAMKQEAEWEESEGQDDEGTSDDHSEDDSVGVES